MKRLSTFLSTGFAAFALLAAAPLLTISSTANAGGSVSVSKHGFSVNLHDVHHYNHGYKHKKYKKRQYRKRYSNDYYGSKRYYDNSYNAKRYYKNKRRYNNYRGGYQNGYRDRSYNNSYNNNYCPSSNYSRYDYRDRDCYSHGDHYHCE